MTRTKEKEYTKQYTLLLKIKVTHAHGGLFIPDLYTAKPFHTVLYWTEPFIKMHSPSSPIASHCIGGE